MSGLNLFLTIGGSIYLLIVLFALFYYFSAMSGKNKILPRTPIDDNFTEPFVSIIVPTYNEERNIAICLQSLKNLNYSNYEIIVSDGGSTDKTIDIAESMVSRVVVDETLPTGWIGKNWGCHLGYLHARGEYLLFVDADTEHTPESLKFFMKIALERNTALLSVFPYQRLQHWWESINPVFYFASNLTYGGRNSVNDPRKPNSHTASGQYMLFKRIDYEAFGGHEYLKGSIVEDLALARVVKQKHKRLFFIDGTKLIYTRMYPESPKQCWEGWKKCLFPGTKLTQPRRITGALMWFLWGLISPVAIGLTAAYAPWYYLMISCFLHVFCITAVFLYWNKKGTHLVITYLLFPLVDIVFCLLLAVSALQIVISKKMTWRGREYTPDLFAGSIIYTNNNNFVGDTTRLAQLNTDIEIELDDQIYSHVFTVQKVANKTPAKAVLNEIEEPISATIKNNIWDNSQNHVE
ncbi:MAG: glycosyltransferase [Candidatus Heimdallarchaeota archaeon]|nr:glycosyltransferase [Candidatus Heimdallarchaeota archaeon]